MASGNRLQDFDSSGVSPVDLLGRVSDEQTSINIAKFSSETQLHCQNFCVKQAEDSLIDDDSLSQESLKAIERQCNKLCIRKFFKAYSFHNKFIKGSQQ